VSPTVVVDGVGFVEFAVPPVGVVYQFKLQFGDGVTDRGSAISF
jgi:hypothetical protein